MRFAHGAIGKRRLSAQGLARPSFTAAEDVVAWLGAVQAQDYGAAKWAVGVRLRDGSTTDALVESALDEGRVLRTHALRGTWQLVVPPDIRWMLELVAPRIVARSARRYRELGLDPATFRRSARVFDKALAPGVARTRDELAMALTRAGISIEGQRFAFLAQRAELDGLICSGPRQGRQSTHVLLEARAPNPPRRRSRIEALRELALRYFCSRGPATLRDFTWWSGFAPADARAAVAASEGALGTDAHDGVRYWFGEASMASDSRSPSAVLLPAFDEYLIGYRDRDDVLDPVHTGRVNAGGGLLDPCIVLDGRVQGTWRRTLARGQVAIELESFEPQSARVRRAVELAARRYARFVERAAVFADAGSSAR